MNFKYALNFRVRPVTDIHTLGNIFWKKAKTERQKFDKCMLCATVFKIRGYKLLKRNHCKNLSKNDLLSKMDHLLLLHGWQIKRIAIANVWNSFHKIFFDFLNLELWTGFNFRRNIKQTAELLFQRIETLENIKQEFSFLLKWRR